MSVDFGVNNLLADIDWENILEKIKRYFNILEVKNVDLNILNSVLFKAGIYSVGKFLSDGLFLVINVKDLKFTFLTRSLSITGLRRETKVIRSNGCHFLEYFDNFFSEDDNKSNYRIKSKINIEKNYNVSFYDSYKFNNFNNIIEFSYKNCYSFNHSLSVNVLLTEENKFILNYYYNILNFNEAEEYNDFVILFLNNAKFIVWGIKLINVFPISIGDISLNMDGSGFLNTMIDFSFDQIYYNYTENLSNIMKFILKK